MNNIIRFINNCTGNVIIATAISWASSMDCCFMQEWNGMKWYRHNARTMTRSRSDTNSWVLWDALEKRLNGNVIVADADTLTSIGGGSRRGHLKTLLVKSENSCQSAMQRFERSVVLKATPRSKETTFQPNCFEFAELFCYMPAMVLWIACRMNGEDFVRSVWKDDCDKEGPVLGKNKRMASFLKKNSCWRALVGVGSRKLHRMTTLFLADTNNTCSCTAW